MFDALKPRHQSSAVGGTRLLEWATVLFIFYLSYRYPLQINYTGTSPTYSDTPVSLQLGKVALAVLLSLFAALFLKVRSLNAKSSIFCVTLVALSGYSFLKAMTGEVLFASFAFWPLAALALCLYSGQIDIRRIDRGIRYLLIISAIVDVIQISLFFVNGRLPALAWEGSVSIRFGSFLDDPNGFAALCFLFLGWAWCHPTRWGRIGYSLTSLAMLLATQSLTAIVFLIPLLIALCLRALWRRPILIALLLPAVIAASVLGASAVGEAAQAIYEYKQGSIEGHSVNISDLLSGGFLQLLFGATEYGGYESWWAQSLYNWGAIWTLLLIALQIYVVLSLIKSYRFARRTKFEGVWFGMLFFAAYVMIGSANLPFFLIFPVNYLFFAIACAVAFNKIHIGRLAGVARRQTE